MGIETAEDQEMAIITREFGLALKVQLRMSEPMSNRADKADAKQGTGLSTIAAGVTNAGTKPLPLESQ